MTKQTVTKCSAEQELFVPHTGHAMFHARDTPRAPDENRVMSDLMNSEQRGRAAFVRFSELLNDLAYDEKMAIELLFSRIKESNDFTKKSVAQWFSRQRIPAHMIFNTADVLGIDVGWLGGSNSIRKERAIQKGGLYQLERERLGRIRAMNPAEASRKSRKVG